MLLRLCKELAYPSLCLHCEEPCDKLVCSGCACFFELCDPQKRCRYCFVEGCYVCPICKEMDGRIRMGAALDYLGGVVRFVEKMKGGVRTDLVETAGALMVAQFYRMKWKLPDAITCVPSRKLSTPKDHSYYLARELARQLQVPFLNLLDRPGWQLTQKKKSFDQRRQLSAFQFVPKKRLDNFWNKRLLIVDDLIVTGTTLLKCATAIDQRFFPYRIEGFAFARSIL